MTDNEIKKALKEILETMLVMGDLQTSSTISRALALFNRLQAENERLQLLFESVINSRDGYIKVIEQYKAENERLKGIKTTDWLVKGISKEQLQEEKIQALTEEINRLQATIDSFTDIGKLYSEIKAEAYKECIEKVKEYIDTYEHLACEECKCLPISKDGLDNLYKEMVGEDNG